MEDKEAPEAKKMLLDVLTFCSNIANNPEGMEFMDIHLVNHAFASFYNNHLKNITQLTGNCHLVDSWMDKYYQSMEKVLREMSLKVPEQRSKHSLNLTCPQVLESIDPLVSYESMYQSYQTLASGWASLMEKHGCVPEEDLHHLILKVSAFHSILLLPLLSKLSSSVFHHLALPYKPGWLCFGAYGQKNQ